MNTRYAFAMTGILFLGALAATGCGHPEEGAPEAEKARNVRVLELTGESISEYFEVSGPVAPVRGTWLAAQESGPVVAIPADKGDAVAEGGVIVEQERDILRAEKEASAAAYETQAYNLDKVQKLYEAGKVSRIELLNAESAHAQAKSAAEISAERYDRAAIKAPFDGVVTDRAVELGELVGPGQPVARLIDPYTLQLEAHLTASEVAWVETGDPATVLLGDGVSPAPGFVRWVGFEADRMTGKFRLEIEIPNPDLVFRSGVIGRARLGKQQESDVVVVPRDAVLNGRIGPTAFVVVGDRAVIRQLTLDADQGLMVVVREGLAPGDRLVVRGQRELRDGSLVNVTEVATAPDGSMPGDPEVISGGTAGSRIEPVPEGTDAEGDR